MRSLVVVILFAGCLWSAEPDVLGFGPESERNALVAVVVDEGKTLPARLEAARRVMHDAESQAENLLNMIPKIGNKHVRSVMTGLFIERFPANEVMLRTALFDQSKGEAKVHRQAAEDLLSVCPAERRVDVLKVLLDDSRAADLRKWQSTILLWDNAASVLAEAKPDGGRRAGVTFIIDSWIQWLGQSDERKAFLKTMPKGDQNALELYHDMYGISGAMELREALKNTEDPSEQAVLIEALADLGDTGSVQLIEPFARFGATATVKGAAIDALNDLDHVLPLDELLIMAKDRTAAGKRSISFGELKIHRIDYPIAEAAIRGIGHHRGSEPFLALVGMVKNHQEDGTAIIEAVCDALATYGDPSAFDMVMSIQKQLFSAKLLEAEDRASKALDALAARRGKTILKHDRMMVYDITYADGDKTFRLITDRPVIHVTEPSVLRKIWQNQYQMTQRVWTIKPAEWDILYDRWSKPDAPIQVKLGGKETRFDLVDAGGKFITESSRN